MARREETVKSARRVEAYFMKDFESERAIGDVGIATAKRCIALAKSKYKGGTNNIGELLKVS